MKSNNNNFDSMKSTAFILAIFAFISCNKNAVETIDYSKTSRVTISFSHAVGEKGLSLANTAYVNPSGEEFKVTALKYFISNISFTKTDGSVYAVPQDSCYFIIDHSQSSSLTPIVTTPAGQYTKMSFLIGVDSLRNTKDISQRLGALDPTGSAADMYWTWNSGYIFFKMEGSSPVSPQTDKSFRYHIGLYGGNSSGTINNIKRININFSPENIVKVAESKNSTIYLKGDILKVFSSKNNISIASNSVVMATPNSASIAENYANMFTHVKTTND
jgi:hypothetical protein